MAFDKFDRLKDAYTNEIGACTSKVSDTAVKQQAYQGAAQNNATTQPWGNALGGNYSGYSNGTYLYPYYSQTVYIDKTEKAFTIAKRLMDKDLVTCDTVKQFITLIDLLIAAL